MSDRERRIAIQTSESFEHINVEARVVFMDGGHAQHAEGDAERDLVIYGQADNPINTDVDPSGAIYGWGIEYRNPWVVDRDRAEAMAHTLERIERRMLAIADQIGEPKTFVSFLVRAARVLGAEAYGFEDEVYVIEQNEDWFDDVQLHDELYGVIRARRARAAQTP